MSPQDKRAIIDKIFGFHILNQMREVLKAEIKKLKESSDFLGGKINSLEMSLNSSLKEMEQLTTKIEEQSQNKIQELEKTLSTFEELQRVHGDKVLDLKEKEETLKNRLYSTNQSLFDSRSKVKELIRKLGLYESDKCPTCESSLNTEFHQSMKEELQIEKQKLEKSITEADNEYQKMITLKDSLDVNKNEILEKGMKIRARIESILKEIGDLKKEDVNLQTQSLQRILQTLENDKNTLTVEKYQKEEKQSWFKSLDEILSERGVKQMAIRTILPSLNSEIVELLKKMNLGYQVIFDEEFSANIYHMGMEISSQTLSTGEMKKIDFVVLISIMKLMKMKFSNINLLFLDELFSSVDQEGVYQITSILKDSSRELGLNIFVINHAPMPHEIFDYKIEITKANNFSSILLDKF
jgi:DNA repair exonuclease SbcCD ATPase subunit